MQEITEFSTDVSAGTLASSYKATMHIEIMNCFTVPFLSLLRNRGYTILTIISSVDNLRSYEKQKALLDCMYSARMRQDNL